MVYMKISAIGPRLYFNGSDKNYKEIVKEKSNTTLKLAIGTAVAGAGLLAVYYLSRGSKGASRAIGQKISSKKSTEQKLANKFEEKSEKTIEKNGLKIVKKETYDGHTKTVEKLFLDKNGEETRKQSVITELTTTAGIPTGYKRTIRNFADGKQTTNRITYLTLDKKPLRTESNGKTIIYGYSTQSPDKVIGYAQSDNGKFILTFEDNKKFKKEFSDLESIYKWAKGNFVNF